MLISNSIDQTNSMYPCVGYMVENATVSSTPDQQFCSIYGFCFGDSIITVDGKQHNLELDQFFGLKVSKNFSITTNSKVFVVVRYGYQVPNTIGWVERCGRLSYIDGCSDSLLVYPARMGDSSLNLLYFPPGINQSFHRHPSIRIGCVARGKGFGSHGEANAVVEDHLEAGKAFCLLEQERHRFHTEDEDMTVIAFHPDGDWGPTDHNHTMLNRTYLTK